MIQFKGPFWKVIRYNIMSRVILLDRKILVLNLVSFKVEQGLVARKNFFECSLVEPNQCTSLVGSSNSPQKNNNESAEREVKRNIIRFNPPFNNKTSTNIGQFFLNIIKSTSCNNTSLTGSSTKTMSW